MPLTPRYEWRQSPKEVVLDVTMPSTDLSAADVYCADCYVKINAAPFLLALDLHGLIEPENVHVTIDRTAHQLSMRLPKAEVSSWPGLTMSGSAAEVTSRREASIQRRTEALEKAAETAKKQRRTMEDRAVKAQLEVDEAQRRQLESAQAAEKKQAEAEMFAALATLKPESQPPSQQKSALTAVPEALRDDDDDEDAAEQSAASAKTSTSASKPAVASTTAAEDRATLAPLPPPRSAPNASSKVAVAFSQRAFPTPLRESRQKEEEDWLARNYAKAKERAMLAKGTPNPAVPFTERDPTWLKGKGDDFFKLGDLDSAISAYSAALQERPRFIAALLNRSACYLKTLKLEQCDQDCGAILAALSSDHRDEDGRDASAQAAKAHARRMLVRSYQGRFSDALEDASAAVELQPGVPDMAACVEKLQSLCAAEACKLQGDAHQKASRADAAIESYTAALQQEPEYVQCMLNRAAAYLTLGQHLRCAADCLQVLSLLGVDEQGNLAADKAAQPFGAGGSMDLSAVPVRGTALFSQCAVRAVARVAEAKKRVATAQS